MKRLRKAVLSNQNKDGGFPRKRISDNVPKFILEYPLHLINGGFKLKLWLERVSELLKRGRFFSTNGNSQRDVPGDWANGKFNQNDSTLWDTWFSLMTCSLIDKIQEGDLVNNNFHRTIGIGFLKK